MSLSGTLTKAHIIEAVVQNNGYTQQKASETVEILLELIKSTLKDSEYVLISSFGKFCVKKKKVARQKSGNRQRPDK
jgi:integration host factor subunit alpha